MVRCAHLPPVAVVVVALVKMYYFLSLTIYQPYQRTDPKSEEYFQAPERKGGPTDPLTHFEYIAEALFQISKGAPDRPYKSLAEYPMYQYLALFSATGSAI